MLHRQACTHPQENYGRQLFQVLKLSTSDQQLGMYHINITWLEEGWAANCWHF
jgi:hypothetical protein